MLEENSDVSDELPEQSVLEENIDVSDVRLGLFLDFHGVIDKDLRETRVLLHSVHQDLPQLRVYCISFCKDPRKIANIRRICQDLQLIPIITPSKFGRWDGKRAYLDWQIRRDDLQSVFFVDDQRALAEHVCSNSEIARGHVLEEHQRIISLHGEITDHFYGILALCALSEQTLRARGDRSQGIRKTGPSHQLIQCNLLHHQFGAFSCTLCSPHWVS